MDVVSGWKGYIWLLDSTTYFSSIGSALSAASGTDETGISLNEDNSYYYFSRAGQKLDAETVGSFIDQYAGTEVRKLMLSPNLQRTSYGSKVWDPIWLGYDPAAPDDQPLFQLYAHPDVSAYRHAFHGEWNYDLLPRTVAL